jgi:hypothetical protein
VLLRPKACDTLAKRVSYQSVTHDELPPVLCTCAPRVRRERAVCDRRGVAAQRGHTRARERNAPKDVAQSNGTSGPRCAGLGPRAEVSSLFAAPGAGPDHWRSDARPACACSQPDRELFYGPVGKRVKLRSRDWTPLSGPTHQEPLGTQTEPRGLIDTRTD